MLGHGIVVCEGGREFLQKIGRDDKKTEIYGKDFYLKLFLDCMKVEA